MQGRMGGNQLQWYVVPRTSSMFLNEIIPVCQTNQACAAFPLIGDVPIPDDEEVNPEDMTCYKGGETVFNNHQICNVTSAFFLRLHKRVIPTGAQIERS